MLHLLKPKSAGHHYNPWQGEAIITEQLEPCQCSQGRFRVKFGGSLWFADCLEDRVLKPGETVYVVGRNNITLLVSCASR